MATNGNIPREAAVQLPVIDISELTPEVGKSMIEAAAKYGFLYIDTKGTAFTEDIVDREFAISKQFFSSSRKEKEACAIGDDNRGWTGMHGELLDPAHQKRGDFKEAFNIGEFHHETRKPQQKMPQIFSSQLSSLADFESRCISTCNKIFRLMALGLEMKDKEWFVDRHSKPSGCTVRLLHYPALPSGTDLDDEVDIRAGAHSDYGSITLLFQRRSQPGLEIRTPQATWAPVPVFPDGYKTSSTFPPILVNMADLLSYWTNGLLKSTVHRVIFPKDARRGGEDRYSIAYFCHPADTAELVAVPSEIVAARTMSEEEKVGYGGGAEGAKALTAKEHLERRLNATYGFKMDKVATSVEATA